MENILDRIELFSFTKNWYGKSGADWKNTSFRILELGLFEFLEAKIVQLYDKATFCWNACSCPFASFFYFSAKII